MTDTQQINASVLADWLECVKQMRDSFRAYKATLDAYDTKKNFVDILAIRMESATPDLDALRALVAEQERASAGETPQFAVGDTVIYDGEAPFYVMPKYEKSPLKILRLRDRFDRVAEVPCAECARLDDDSDYNTIPLANLTLVSKAVKA